MPRAEVGGAPMQGRQKQPERQQRCGVRMHPRSPAGAAMRERVRTWLPWVSVSRTSYWSPLVTTRSPASFARTSRHAMTRFASPRTRPASTRKNNHIPGAGSSRSRADQALGQCQQAT